MHRQLEVWTGGQTGVDRAALDAALELGLPIAGWVPRGRLAEDGLVPACYDQLREAESADYAIRTRLNVQDTDATLVLRVGMATGGTLETMDTARRLQRPLLVIDLEVTDAARAATAVIQWLEGLFKTRPSIRLNVAGPRASQAPTAYARARETLWRALASHAGA
jgi:predicted Rossmann fold nucleotide-binding protein DprA/Smf involved in DNA uptake